MVCREQGAGTEGVELVEFGVPGGFGQRWVDADGGRRHKSRREQPVVEAAQCGGAVGDGHCGGLVGEVDGGGVHDAVGVGGGGQVAVVVVAESGQVAVRVGDGGQSPVR